MAREHIVKVKSGHAALKGDNHVIESVSIFQHIVDSDMPESELSVDRLTKEAQVLLGAGTISTARTMAFISVYLLTNPAMRSKLEADLQPVMANFPQRIPSNSELKKLPYLQAVIKEGLRYASLLYTSYSMFGTDHQAIISLSYGVMHNLPHCSPDTAIQYRQWKIQIGVPVGMSAYLMHTDATVYENPFEFVPERWLGRYNPLQDRNFVPFSRGPRNCLGMQ